MEEIHPINTRAARAHGCCGVEKVERCFLLLRAETRGGSSATSMLFWAHVWLAET
jgi:hypothetical protein